MRRVAVIMTVLCVALAGMVVAQQPPAPITPAASPADTLARVETARAAVVAAQKALSDAMAAHYRSIEETYGPWAKAPGKGNTLSPPAASPVGAAAPARVVNPRDSVATVVSGGKVFGSAVVIGQGRLLTCAHVVGQETAVLVRFPGGPALEAKVLASDPSLDLAILAASTEGHAALPLGVALAVGARVHVAGLAGMADGKVTLTGTEIRTAKGAVVSGVAKTDAAIGKDDSGSPVLNDAGELAGLACVWRDDLRLLEFVIPAGHAAGLLKGRTRQVFELGK